MGKKLTELISSNSKDARLVRSIDSHRHSVTGEEDMEWRRNVHVSGSTDQGDT